MVTLDGAEIGGAQWVQALAARAEPEAAMNPVLLKPGSDRRSHVVVMGRPHGELEAASFAGERSALASAAHAAYDDLRTRFDVVICEGAGSPAKINLRRWDYVNMGLARHGQIPAIVVGDIDRGGCSPRCSAPSRCSMRPTKSWFLPLWSTSSAATRAS